MNIYYYILFGFAGIIAALPVILCQAYYVHNKFNFSLGFVFLLLVLWSIITLIYIYCIIKKIKLGVFYPVIKLFEIFVPILVGIFLYKEKYNYYNYFGVLLAIVAIYLITIK